MRFRNKLKAMLDHLNDAKQSIGGADYEADPYFISYLLLYRNYNGLVVSDGELVNEYRDSEQNSLRAEVRVGDYSFDGKGAETTDLVPVGDNYTAMRNLLWNITWPAFNEAQIDLLEKKQEAIEDEGAFFSESFAKVDPVRYRCRIRTEPEFNLERRAEALKDISRLFNDQKEIMSSRISFSTENMLRVYVNSEGTNIVQHQMFYTLGVEANITASEDGEVISLVKRYYTMDLRQLPSKRILRKDAEELMSLIKEMKEAPVQRPGIYPAIFDPETSEVVFHEIVGHRLEGERQDRDYEGDTFQDRIGERIAPDFVNMVDDPSVREFTDWRGRKHTLFGNYRYDDEGVEGKKVVLIEEGVLKDYLLSRVPVYDHNVPPNGHSRCDGSEDPVARMSNLFVSSSRPVSQDRLKEMLMEECERQGKDYGLVFSGSRGGHTDTEDDNFRIFSQVVHRLWAKDATDPDTGKRFSRGDLQLVRGVEISGTPITILNNLVAMSDDYSIGPGECGAESGWVKVCGIAPSSFFTSVETKPTTTRMKPNPAPKPSTYLGNGRGRRG